MSVTVCNEPGCANLTAHGKCSVCRRTQRQASDKRRPNAHDRGYNREWDRTRRRYLTMNPYCECDDCVERPLLERDRATDVDHIDGQGPSGPRGHDHTNLRAMSHAHHARRTARDQPGGFNRSTDRWVT